MSYIALRAGRAVDARPTIERLVDECAHFSDAHVLHGECDAALGRPAADDAFARAVAEGAPVFAEGLTILLTGRPGVSSSHDQLRARCVQTSPETLPYNLMSANADNGRTSNDSTSASGS